MPDYIEYSSVDLRWSPNPLDPPYIYHFPSQWQSASGVTYAVPGATAIKLVDDFVVKAISRPDRFLTRLPVKNFDYSWHPNVLDPDCIYVFGNQWNPAVLESTIEYHQGFSTEHKYLDEPIAEIGRAHV